MGSAASAEALTVICGLHCTYKPQIPVRTLNHSQPIMLTLFRPLAGRSLKLSPCLSTLNSADFIVGTGMRGEGCNGCDRCDSIYTPGGTTVATVASVAVSFPWG